MIVAQLGKLTTVDPRQIWPNEEKDFTPWLAQNISELSSVLGIEIEVKKTEKKVGAYELDIYAVDKDNPDTIIIVENQLEQTNHVHLGQLLAYAAGLDAKVVVWVAPLIRDEHRVTIEWLNRTTTEAVRFFLVRVEVVKIDNSLPAVRFEVEVAPTEFVGPAPPPQTVAPKMIRWADSPNAPVPVATWREAFQKTLDRAVQDGHDVKDLPVKFDTDEDNFRASVTVQTSGGAIYVDSHGSASELRRRMTNVLKKVGRPPKFMRIECENDSVFELP